MIKVLQFLILGGKYIGSNLFLVQISWGAVFLGTICPRGNYVDNKSSEKQFLQGQFPGGYFQGAIIFGVIIQEQ